MPRNRLTAPGAAAVLLKGVWAGSMDSRKGKAKVVPTPRRNVRRGMCFFVMTITGSFLATSLKLVRVLRSFRPHLKLRALDDAHQDRRKSIILFLRMLS